MFGDAGHGTIMFLSALFLVLYEKKIEAAKIKDEIFNTFYGGRYVILLMGAFAIYTGFIYNDFFSMSINIFGSSWNPYNQNWTTQAEIQQILLDASHANKSQADWGTLTLDPRFTYLHDKGPYPFGLDPVWNLAKNRLSYVNPMKMKGSIILGIGQMFFGLILSLFNHVHYHSTVDIFFVFIPQLLFLSLIFVYLCVQVVIKWIFFWVEPGKIFGQTYPGPFCAPSLLIGLIDMFMLKERGVGFVHDVKLDNGTVAHDVLRDQCHLVQWYPNQYYIQAAMLVVAVLSIPVMLFVKPVWQWMKARRGEHVDTGHGHGGDDEHAEFSFGDAFVYQAIHTIEFALGCVSHTASYLRLWALSLAHA
ncbi:Protein VHA-6, partial [Aphelenchoides avenae]